MGQIGFPELIVILIVALLVLGPKRLPEVARSLGRGLAEFRRAARDVETQVRAAIAEADQEGQKGQPGPPQAVPQGDPKGPPAAEAGSPPARENKASVTPAGGGE